VTRTQLSAEGCVRGVIVVVVVLALLCACSKEVIWSAKVVSPNGKWIASARTDVWDGPGVGAAATAVCLARSIEPNQCTDVVVYPPSATNPTPKIIWTSDDELVVRIPDPSKVVLQTVKFSNIRIVLEALPNGDSAAIRPLP
jgi:hypothetical protein